MNAYCPGLSAQNAANTLKQSGLAAAVGQEPQISPFLPKNLPVKYLALPVAEIDIINFKQAALLHHRVLHI